ncbi:MAG: amidohydrolase family protein, partial [Pseudomonadota bacterium]
FSAALIPAWVRADSTEAMFNRIDNADLAEGIREEMEANLWRRGGADSLLVTGADSEFRGKTLDEIAQALGADALEAAIEVVRRGDPSIASFNMNPDDIQAIAIQDWVMTGSDGSSGHPRKYASYPTVYRTMVVDEGWFSLERFVQRSSADVADALRMCDRGYIEPGRVADIVLIDLDTYEPVADFQNPSELATGLRYALINGQLAVEDGVMNGSLAGSIVNRQALDCPD